MDIRNNMINWVHRSTRGWSYGYPVTDPRTGEIIKGQVTLGSLRVRQDMLIARGLLAPFAEDGSVDPRVEEMGLARLRQLAAHELGHTLGLMHNHAASARWARVGDGLSLSADSSERQRRTRSIPGPTTSASGNGTRLRSPSATANLNGPKMRATNWKKFSGIQSKVA